MDGYVILYTTWPDAETAEGLAAEAVAQRLAACANILAPMRSIYRWQEAVEQSVEIPMLLKTTRQAAPALRDMVLAAHPYDLPCVVALTIDTANSAPAFLSWIAAEASSPPDEQ